MSAAARISGNPVEQPASEIDSHDRAALVAGIVPQTEAVSPTFQIVFLKTTSASSSPPTAQSVSVGGTGLAWLQCRFQEQFDRGKIARQQERLSVVALSLVLSRPSSSPENAVAVPDCADGSRRRALLTQARRSQLPWWRIAGLEQTVSWEVQ